MSRADIQRAVEPLHLLIYPRLRSTSVHARTLIDAKKLNAPSLVLTQNQTAGKGRGQNVWWSGPGCLTTTFVFRADPQLPVEQIPLYAGVALRRALLPFIDRKELLLKWPNDLIFEHRKLAGLLCERCRHFDLIGIGLNIAPRRVPKSLEPHLASLAMMTKTPPPLPTLLQSITRELSQTLYSKDRIPFALLRREYDQHHFLLGRELLITTENGTPPLTGRCEGIDASGRLLLRHARGLHRILTGTVQTRDKQ